MKTKHIKRNSKNRFSCSILIPCFNEEDNIEETIKQAPQIGKFTEIIVVNDCSTDRSKQKAEALKEKYKNLKVISHKINQGKGLAVKTGINAAKGDIIIVWDADRTVPANELRLFYDALAKGVGSFANGTRVVYPMEKQAMPALRTFGNNMLGHLFSWIIGIKITDTLCGTKALFRKGAKKIEFGKEVWGDFDLLLGAAKLNLKIVEVPVHYKARVAGKSKMKTFRYGSTIGIMALKSFFEFKIKPILRGFTQ